MGFMLFADHQETILLSTVLVTELLKNLRFFAVREADYSLK